MIMRSILTARRRAGTVAMPHAISQVSMTPTSHQNFTTQKTPVAKGESNSSPEAVDKESIDKPTFRQKSIHGLNSAIPFVGFGMMDNTIMIHAGDLIDQTIGVRFGLPTLMAAASGQVLSDFCGVCFGGAIESLAVKLGLPQSGMSVEQLNLSEVGVVRTACSAFGVVIGCSLAMLQMLLMDFTKADRLKAKKEVAPLFNSIALEAKNLLDCNRVTLYVCTTLTGPPRHPDEETHQEEVLISLAFHLTAPTLEELSTAFHLVDTNQDDLVTFKELQEVIARLGYRRHVKETRQLFAEAATAFHKSGIRTADGEEALDIGGFAELVPKLLENLGTEIAVRVEESSVLQLALKEGASGEITNIPDQEVWHRKNSGNVPLRWRCLTGMKTKSVLLCPVLERDTGKLVGLIEAVNKNKGAFDASDERVVHALASHAGSILSRDGLLDAISDDFDR